MKNIIAILVVTGTLTLTQNSQAQTDSSGIYKTASDFQNKKLSYAINYKTEKHKIKSSMLFNNDQIKVKHEGTMYTLKKMKPSAIGIQKEGIIGL